MKKLIIGIIFSIAGIAFFFLLSYADKLDYKLWYRMGLAITSLFGAVAFIILGLYFLVDYFSDK